MKPYGNPKLRGPPMDPNSNDARRHYRVFKRVQRKRERRSAREEMVDSTVSETLTEAPEAITEAPSAVQSSLEDLLGRYPKVDPELWGKLPEALARWQTRALRESAFIEAMVSRWVTLLDERPEDVLRVLSGLEIEVIGLSPRIDPISGSYLEVRANDPHHRHSDLCEIIAYEMSIPVRVEHVPPEKRFTGITSD